MRRLSSGLLLALLLVSRVGAQVTGPVSITAVDAGNACSVAAACANFQVGSVPSLTLQVSGTFTGTLTFEATSDGTNWLAIGLVNPATGASATTTTAPGQFALPNWGIVRVRVRATAFTSGSASVTMTRGVGTHLSAASGGGGGASLPTAALGQVLISQGAGTAPVFSNSPSLIGSPASVVLIESSAAVDARRWRIGTLTGGYLVIDEESDAGVSTRRPFYLVRGGGANFLGNVNANQVVTAQIQMGERPFAGIVPGVIGDLVNVNNSTTAVPGAIVTTGGTNGVLARWNGTNWVVVGGVAGAPTEVVTSAVSSATPAPVGAGARNLYLLTALAATATFAAPTGTPVDGSYLTIRVKDNGTPQTLAWNAIYRAGSVALPITTTTSKTMYIGFRYNAADTKWDLTALATGF
jgi:hypothetical protein